MHVRASWLVLIRVLAVFLFLLVLILPISASGQERLPLVVAAKNADSGGVRALLEQGAAVNAADPDGTTALHWASYQDDVETADLLINSGADVNATSDLGATPLWVACENGSLAMVQKLLSAGAAPNAPLLLGETPLMIASRGGTPDVVEQLLAKGADVNASAARGQTALMWAVAQKHADVVEVLLAHGADVHARSEVWSQMMAVPPHGRPEYNREIPHGGNTALMFAARVGDLASAKFLVAAGASVNDMDAWGVSATVLAAHSGYGALVGFLLENGGDPNVAAAGFTALHEAIMRRDERMVTALLTHGADPNAVLQTWTAKRRGSRDFNFSPPLVGATPFWLAARFAQPNVMRLLAEHGADPLFVHHAEYTPDDGAGRVAGGPVAPLGPQREATTALMAAVGMGGRRLRAWVPPDRSQLDALTLEAVKLAVELGVDVNATDTDGRTALDGATALGHERVVQFLVEQGAEPGVVKLRSRVAE